MRLPNQRRNRIQPFHFDDNPLSLRLSGRGYARRLWGFLPRRRLPRARVSPVLVVLVLCFCCCYGYGIVLLPIILLSLHSGVFERLWRDEARSGRLVEWRLCMSSEEIVRGDFLDRVHIGLDFFDASINRVAAWVIGVRAMLKALLLALLEPTATIRLPSTARASAMENCSSTVTILPE